MAEKLKRRIELFCPEAELLIDLYDSFDLAFNAIRKHDADMILVPNAYDKITEFYWDRDLELVYSFSSKTPIYGLATLESNKCKRKNKYSIVTCKAVKHLVEQLWQTTSFKDKDFYLLDANSTKKSLEALQEDKADFALTNESSLLGSEAFFVSETMSTEVLWSVFMSY